MEEREGETDIRESDAVAISVIRLGGVTKESRKQYKARGCWAIGDK